MNRFSKLALLLCAMMLAVLVMSACKSEEELANAYGEEPTVISPDVNITQAAKEETPTINVSGAGKVVLKPDTAEISVEIYTEDAAPDKAQAANAELTASVTAAILACGVKESDVQTQETYLNEIYNYDKSPAVITGYSMNTVLRVTVRDIDSVGKVIGDAVAAGATGTYGLSMSVSDTAGAYQQALQAAVADAAAKAQAMAEALGVGIFAVPVSVNETSAGEGVIYNADMNSLRGEPAAEMPAEGVDMPVSTGEITVTASVSIAYGIYEPNA